MHQPPTHHHHSNSKLHDRAEIEQYYEKKSYQFKWGDPKTFFEPYPNRPQKWPIRAKKSQKWLQNWVRIEGTIGNKSCWTIFVDPKTALIGPQFIWWGFVQSSAQTITKWTEVFIARKTYSLKIISSLFYCSSLKIIGTHLISFGGITGNSNLVVFNWDFISNCRTNVKFLLFYPNHRMTLYSEFDHVDFLTLTSRQK